MDLNRLYIDIPAWRSAGRYPDCWRQPSRASALSYDTRTTRNIELDQKLSYGQVSVICTYPLMEALLKVLPGPQPIYIRYGATALLVLLAHALKLGVNDIAGPYAFIIYVPAFVAAALMFDRLSGYEEGWSGYCVEVATPLFRAKGSPLQSSSVPNAVSGMSEPNGTA